MLMSKNYIIQNMHVLLKNILQVILDAIYEKSHLHKVMET